MSTLRTRLESRNPIAEIAQKTTPPYISIVAQLPIKEIRGDVSSSATGSGREGHYRQELVALDAISTGSSTTRMLLREAFCPLHLLGSFGERRAHGCPCSPFPAADSNATAPLMSVVPYAAMSQRFPSQ